LIDDLGRQPKSRICAGFAEFCQLLPDSEIVSIESGALIQERNPRQQDPGDSNMRELTIDEIDAVSGGITGLKMGLGPNVGLTMLAASFFAGYSIGTAIYNAYTDYRY